jgi:hypothetical protein
MTAEDLAREGIAKHRAGDVSGWRLLWQASQVWRAAGDAARADVADAEARRLRVVANPLSPLIDLDLDGAAQRLGVQ